MIKAMALKELRETLGIAAVALGLYLVLVSNLVGLGTFTWVPTLPTMTTEVPFTGWEFLGTYTLVTAAFAIALGYRQSLWEERGSTYQFLLHRPVPRGQLMLMKLATGTLVYLIAAAVPILVYGAWAATPGNLPSPFEWSMTRPAWCLWFTMVLVYLGAFFSGLWPARWLGTRLLPLAAGGLLATAVFSLPWWYVSLALTLGLGAVLAASVCDVARARDYS